MTLYKFNNAVVQYNNTVSSSFNMETGVKQGSVLSAYLFTLYMDNLVNALINTRVGCMMGSRLVNTLVYADDVVLIAPSVGALKILLKECEAFTNTHHVNFNSNKSSLLHFNKSRQLNNCPNIDVKLCGVPIQLKNEVNYLGTVLRNDINLHNADKCINDMKIRTNVIMNEFRHIDTSARSKLFKSQATCFFSSELFNLDSNYIDRLMTDWRISARKVLKVDKRTHCNLIPPLVKSKDPLLLIEQRILNFFRKMLIHDNGLVKFIANFSHSNSFSYMYKNIMSILHKHSISHEKLYCNQSIKIRDNIAPNWRVTLIHEILSAKDGLLFVNLNNAELNTILYELCVN